MKLTSFFKLRFFIFSFLFVALTSYAGDLPSYFDWRLENPLVRPLNEADKYSSKGIVTPVRDQGYYGTCYAFGAIASFESNFYKQLKEKYSEDSQIELVMPDFSESYLVWLRGAAPTEENTYDGAFFDKAFEDDPSDPPYYAVVSGGYELICSELMRRTSGVAYESDYPYSITELEPVKKIASISFMLHDQYFTEHRSDTENFYNVVIATDSERTEHNIARLKEIIIENGVSSIASCFNSEFIDHTSGAVYAYEDIANHGFGIVGWDDDYDFASSSLAVKPASLGAWMIKNSWSENPGDSGYYYISYEDTTLTQYAAFIPETDRFRYNSLNRNDKLGISNVVKVDFPSSEYSIASRLKAKTPQFVKAVNLPIPLDSMSYELQIKKRGTTPSSGDIVYAQSGKFGENGLAKWAGIRTIDLGKFIYISEGEEYFAVAKLTAPNGEDNFFIPISIASVNNLSSSEYVGYDKTYFKTNGEWVDSVDSVLACEADEDNKESVSSLLATYSKDSNLANGGNFTLLDLNDSSASATIYLGRRDELYEGDALNPSRTTLSDMTAETNTDSLYAGTIWGEGKLIKTGSATLTITGRPDYTGGTDVNDGRYRVVNGTLYGDVNILASGTLQGNITINGKVKNDGVMIPGNSIGQIVVADDYVQNGTVNLEGSLSGGDKITVLGDATINGPVNIELAEGYYPNGTTAIDISKFIVAAGSIDYSAGYVLMPVISSTAIFPDYLQVVVNADGTITAIRDKAKFETSVLGGIGTIAGKDVSSLVFAAKPVTGEAQNLIADLENGIVKYDDVGAVANPELHNTLTLSSIKRNQLISKFMSDKLIKDATTGICKADMGDIKKDENAFAFQFKSEAVQDKRTESAKYKSNAYGT
ncbi:MAG: C1 family peptidase, partial [Candidatus Riflebacteria bacterium]|nr:C1 family peptidase [Candidatus Riflebacteria bacterium]